MTNNVTIQRFNGDALGFCDSRFRRCSYDNSRSINAARFGAPCYNNAEMG
jgi:hypothetical protein